MLKEDKKTTHFYSLLTACSCVSFRETSFIPQTSCTVCPSRIQSRLMPMLTV